MKGRGIRDSLNYNPLVLFRFYANRFIFGSCRVLRQAQDKLRSKAEVETPRNMRSLSTSLEANGKVRMPYIGRKNTR